MESKPSRIPRRISVQPSSSLSARMMSGSRGSSLNDTYHSRDSSFRLDSEYQSTSASASASPFQSAWYSESEITQGARSRSQNQQRDHDSKRPKLSCTNCTTSAGRNVGNGLNTLSDVQDRVPSYSQGARPKENSMSTLQLNTSSTNHQLPSEHQTILSSRDSRNSLRSNFSSRESESSRSNTQPGFSYSSSRDEAPIISNSERVVSSQRPFQESSDNEGRRTTRRLLSRIASSMSSTFFSRRSSQDSLNTRSLNSENSYVSPRILTASQSRSNVPSASEVPDNRASEASQGFRFLRRRWGLSSLSHNHSSESDSENFNQESEGRNTGPWLSSSLRNRCTPLFSRRRREGRDESSRIPTSDTSSRSHIFRRESNEVVHLEAQNDPLGAAANRPQASAASSSATTGGSTSDSAQGGRNTGISGILPGSLFRFAVPPALGSNLTDNVMITVDIIPSGWNSADGKSDKTKSAPSRDPERLQKIKESLLLEDSEEEEGDLCRICQMAAASSSNLLIEPCKCTGSLQYVHQDCMKKWLQAKINSGSSLEAVTTCELCKEKLELNLEDFDIHELHRAHANEQAEYEFISSGLYLVVLLHLCEQSFSDMMGNTNEPSTRVRFINLARTLQAHMEDLETSEDDSEEDGDHNRTFDIA
ncbi:E3 ubiquitin-protein ligase MARCHF7 isoform g [Homo sapiens]|uniref:E3 ubiquitin-protein ligase MARCHF7 isoform g n=1 Tax=Homo sapiens TaxID=9606 RepID=UPI0007DC781C|nr:E3 ubiquitin-protein ligase MARCHF7 isoform g [Homo sapiens]NP_001363177.1 E3 ubiquitin-protein ligase MARCHF7 isoform g [Homo sapiens]XP_047301480.1 E3 ubiquitin-protein ligase MARCHF7 isoform X3 [Homo sapiens]XP_047301481.1 E3 ubiquitin-protein ligase MARCHF7 isoform X3 [Homo sapiens]XP_047301482.1 E3 ubiquitin-protein ligase MARCHF7 isoform X3 [Homo sapiens]XP_047301483.1 E3 ubiquitin-protein ligase MARCHF7 isoform X3 [Homo sapiens]XP_047301484.1 E3 ubiquitin-protein ligase MARCHF7 isof|eukprot:XP_016860208.1 E3 ubiquitin-protein ligase MARCH7 isoform X3 [Homo sapiens]